MNHRGFILITLMLTISLLSLLMFANTQLIILSLKRQYQWHAYQDKKIQLERIAEDLVSKISMHPPHDCMNLQSNNQNISLNTLKKGCLYASFYHYLVSDLGVFPCLQNLNTKPHIGAHHWVLTLMDDRLNAKKIQIRFTTPAPEKLCSSQIPMGILTWQYG